MSSLGNAESDAPTPKLNRDGTRNLSAVARFEIEPSPLPDRPWQLVIVYKDGTREVGGRYGNKAAASRYRNRHQRALVHHNDGGRS